MSTLLLPRCLFSAEAAPAAAKALHTSGTKLTSSLFLILALSSALDRARRGQASYSSPRNEKLGPPHAEASIAAPSLGLSFCSEGLEVTLPTIVLITVLMYQDFFG